MTALMILLGAWFILAQDKRARQNILIMFAVGLVMEVLLWTF